LTKRLHISIVREDNIYSLFHQRNDII